MSVIAPIREKIASGRAARKYFDLISGEMSLVEAEFERQASSNIQVVNYVGDYIRASGGKRVRPALLILANYAVGGDGRAENVIRLATVMEMLHTATLVHDDIIDNAEIRRSRSSVNAKFGNPAAVLMGDWLYMSAFETSLKERSLEILDILTRLTRMMTEGELLQLTVVGKIALSEDEYFDILRRKTAYLFSACCEIGGLLGGADEKRRTALRDYGMDLGIAFQLADDLLDLTSDSETLGKSAGADLLEGKLTLPLIMLRRQDNKIDRILARIFSDKYYHEEGRELLFTRLKAGGMLESAAEVSRKFARSAIKNLDVLPETEYCSALEALPGYVVERVN